MSTIKEVRHMAKSLGLLNIAKLPKPDLIRAVQQAEGNSPCFQQIPGCGQGDCLFLRDCQGGLTKTA